MLSPLRPSAIMGMSTITFINASHGPRTRTRQYAKILAKCSYQTMSSSKIHEKPASKESIENLSELSDVPCYTCRRRHVKCDRQLPTCAKCVKKGVPCLGYQKPLRWAEGVAVRGKLKGKSQPVVDSELNQPYAVKSFC